MLSPLVFTQLETRHARTLSDRLENTLILLAALPKVKFVRIEAPVTLEGVQFNDGRRLREHVRKSIDLLGVPAIRHS